MSSSKQVRAQVMCRDFPGLNFDQDPRDTAAGTAQKQVNMVSFEGQLFPRRGVRELSFEAEVTDS